MNSRIAIEMSIAHERQEQERRIRRDIQRARRGMRSSAIRQRIGMRFIRWGDRLLADASSEPAWSR